MATEVTSTASAQGTSATQATQVTVVTKTTPVVDPLVALLHSRKFLIAAIDAIISVVTHFIAEYAGAQAVADTNFIILTLQPVVIFLIGAIAYEDGQANSAPSS